MRPGTRPMAARRGWKGPAPRSDAEWLRTKLADGLPEDQPEWDGPAIDAAVAAGDTVSVPLPVPLPVPLTVPVHIGCFTVAPGPGGRPRRFADVYRRDAAGPEPEGPGSVHRFSRDAGKVVPRDGIEPPTLRFSIACSTN